MTSTMGAFVDTAAAMSSLDLIVTAGTAVAHLAGALPAALGGTAPALGGGLDARGMQS
jgi:hypothetical protein